MALIDARYTVRFPLPDQIVKGQDHTIQAPIYQSGALVAPTEAGSTVSVYDATNTAIVSAQPVTVTADIAEYQIPAATTASAVLGEGWRVEWSLVVAAATAPDGKVFGRNRAMLVRHPVQPMITDFDIGRRLPALDPSSSRVIHSHTTLQAFIDDAWVVLCKRLLKVGSRPWLVISVDDLYEPLLQLAIAHVFDDLATSLKPAFEELSAKHRGFYESEWNGLSFDYDFDDDGVADTTDQRESAAGSFWLTGR